MTREELMDIVYSELHSDDDNYRANRIIDAADEYVEEQKEWIPCSERLPSEDGLYLAQTKWIFLGVPDIEVYTWAEGWNCYRGSDGAVNREHEIGVEDIIAWMPLPKPYREDDEK